MFEQCVQNAMYNAAQEMQITATSQRQPHVLLRPHIFPDGNAWCALYGEDLQAGVAGFGDTPAAAADDFDRNWNTQKAGPAAGVTAAPALTPHNVDDVMQLVFRYGAARVDVDRSNSAANQKACNDTIEAIRAYLRTCGVAGTFNDQGETR